MATVDECRKALEDLAQRLSDVDDAARRRNAFDRNLGCHITDLDTTFYARLHDGRIDGISTEPAGSAQIRLIMTSDDLVGLVDGRLDFAGAWAKGRVKIEASVMDLLRLRSLLG